MSLPNTSSYFPFITKNSLLASFKGSTGFNIAGYGDYLIGADYPRSTSISSEYYYGVTNFTSKRRKIYALRNTLDFYRALSEHYAFSSSFGDKEDQELRLINIPSVFYGSSIDKGTVELSFYVTGTLLGKLQDINKNGELIQTYGDLGSGSVAGVVLYNEGIIVLTGSWNLDNSFQEFLVYNPVPSLGYAKWVNWGAGLYETLNLTLSSSFDLKFEGVNYVNTLTMLAHAEKGDLNHSNNPTYIEYGQGLSANGNSQKTNGYYENEFMKIKNTIKYPYENYSGSLEKQTFISKIGVYDENKNLIGIAKLAKPIRKTENRDFTFKLKIDI
jgi:hypothetical protein